MNTLFTTTQDFIIHIPESCQENWNEMKPNAHGRFCNACCKTVYDFSAKSPAEIKAVLLQYQSGKPCGYFGEAQLNTPLSVTKIHKGLRFTQIFVTALYLVFGSFLFSCKTEAEPESDGPVFQKGQINIQHFERDSARSRYGGVDYMDYMVPESVDSGLTRSQK